MFQENMEPRTKNKKSSLEKNSFDYMVSNFWKHCLKCLQNGIEKILICKILRWENFARQCIHVSKQSRNKIEN